MKKCIYFLISLVFAFTSCKKAMIIDPTSDQEVELIGTTLKGKLDKVTICHKDKTDVFIGVGAQCQKKVPALQISVRIIAQKLISCS